MSTAHLQQQFFLRLLFDAELRGRFVADPESTCDDEGLDAEDKALFASVDRFGLERDATLRQGYLMSALCRPYVMSAGIIGSSSSGAEALAAFLASPALHGSLHERTAAFGDHLARLYDLDALGLGREVGLLGGAVLALERARVDNAAAIRRRVELDGPEAAPPPPQKPGSAEKKRGRVALPPFFLVGELPLPTGVIRTALDHIGPGDAWERIRAGALSLERVRAAARALPMPVTVLSRGVTRGLSSERAGAGGVSPLVDVTHLTAELSGRRAAELQQLDGALTLGQLPAPLRRLAQPLVEGGLLALE